MKKSRIIAPALGVLILSTAASITGTVAWFTANNSVAVTGMTVKTKVSSNLLIAADALAASTKFAEDAYASGPLTQTVKGVLEPASTVNGQTFFYTTDAKASGDAKADTYVQYGTEAALDNTTTYADAFSKAYGADKTFVTDFTGDENLNKAVPYVDYIFQLRAQNLAGEAQDLKITNLTLTYTAAGQEADSNKAFRAAIFADDVSSASVAGANTLKAIVRPAGSQNFSELEQTPSVKAVGSTSALSAVTYSAPAVNETPAVNPAVLASIASNATKYYKVTVRLWIEGEDTTCNNSTFAALTGSWALDLDAELGGTNAAITQLLLA